MHRHGHSHTHKHSHVHADGAQGEDFQIGTKNLASLKRLLGVALPELPLLILAMISLAISTGVTLIIPFSMGYAIFDEADQSDPWIMLGIFAGVFAGGILFSFLRTFLFSFSGERLIARLRNRLFAQIIIQDVGFFDKNKTGELVNRIAADTTLIQVAMTVQIATVLKFFLQIVGGTVALFVISWKLTLVMIIPLPVALVLNYFYGRFIRRLGKRIQDALAAVTAVAEEAISGMRYVRSFGNEAKEKARFEQKVHTSFTLGKKMSVSYGTYQAGAETVAYIAVLLVISYGAVLYRDGEISRGNLLSFILYALSVAHALGGFSGQSGEFMRALGASERVFQLLDREPEINISGGKTLSRVEGRIEFKKVEFRYPSRPQTPVLTDFDLTLHPAKVVALVGPSGSGKTTIAQLILRLYDVTKGEIFLDGVPIRELDPRWLREQIGFVSQEPVLFNTTIAENISYGKSDATQQEIESAAKSAYIHDVIMSLPDKYDTIVGERGVRLSGGQKQRIAIARAIIKQPTILLLDEATSALDVESEEYVQKALSVLMKGRTVLVIAHRLSTVTNADTVAVINEGKLVEIGSYTELISNQHSTFHKLINKQLLLQDKPQQLTDDSNNKNKKKKKTKKNKKNDQDNNKHSKEKEEKDGAAAAEEKSDVEDYTFETGEV